VESEKRKEKKYRFANTVMPIISN